MYALELDCHASAASDGGINGAPGNMVGVVSGDDVMRTWSKEPWEFGKEVVYKLLQPCGIKPLIDT